MRPGFAIAQGAVGGCQSLRKEDRVGLGVAAFDFGIKALLDQGFNTAGG